MSDDGWLALRWLDAINEMPELRKIVRRGKVLNRKKAVDQLEIAQGLVTAEVEDDGGAIFSVRIRQSPLEAEIWDELLDELAEDAHHSASLLSGRVTEECAEVFDLAGIDLFPFDVRDMTTFCTCSDEGMLCRHAAATHHAVAHALELDPFLLFVFRGMPREELLSKLRELRGVPAGGHAGGDAGDDTASGEVESPESLLDGFWERGVVPHLAFRLEAEESEDEGEGDAEDAGQVALPIVRALGQGPGGLNPEDMVTVLTPIVKMARRRVSEIVNQVSHADAVGEATTPADTENLDEILVAAAHQHGELTTTFVAEAMGVSKQQARKYLQWLVEEGRLTVEGKARSTKYLPV